MGGSKVPDAVKAKSGDFSEIRDNWRLLVAGMFGTGLGLPPVPFYTIGIFAPFLAAEFGWSFAHILSGLVMTPVVLLIGGPIVGHLVDRHGARYVAAISAACLGLSYMTLALSNGSLVQYYLSWVAIAVSGVGASSIAFTRAVTSVFVTRRGLALGITLAGTGLFALAVKPLAHWLLSFTDWRGAIVVIGLLPLLIGAPLALWGLPDKTSKRMAAAAKIQHGGLSFSEALRSRPFWTLVLIFVPVSFANAAPFPNMENILQSVGLSPTEIVATASLIGVNIVAGRLFGGWLMDRIWAPMVGAIALIGAAIGCWILSQHALSREEAVVAVILLGLAAGIEIDLLSYLISRYIGLRSYGVIYGALFGAFAIGAGIGPSLLGHAYDSTGTYSWVLALCGVLLALAGGLLLTLGKYPDNLTHAESGDVQSSAAPREAPT